MNALLFGAIVTGTGLWVWWRRRSLLLCALAAAMALVGPPLVEASQWAWSEPLFVALSLCFLFSIDQWRRHGTARALAAAALLATLAYMTRYAGVTMLATGGAVVGLGRQRSLRKRALKTW